MSRHHHALNAKLWSATRWAVLTRDSFRCSSCGSPGRLEVHHKQALADGGQPYDLGNLETKCRRCHFALTADALAEKLPPEVRAWRQYVNRVIL